MLQSVLTKLQSSWNRINEEPCAAVGIGSFTLVDKGEVDSRDLGKNFLLTPADLKEGKAKAISSRLNELNPSVAGSFVDEDPVEIIANNSEFFRGFSV